ncbi:uncharacterized protein TNCV_740451 [Trichonephila clavipes]|nr:uncharacterized protein TNCV_740451 [Trichonephila clavipes]
MTTGSYMTPIYSRSQSEVLGDLHNSSCKEPLPAPGNRSNERRYKEKDLARTEEKKVGTGEREGWRKTRGGEKKIWLDDGCIVILWEISPCVSGFWYGNQLEYPGISVEGASTIYLKGIFGPAVKCPLVYVPIGLATGGQVNMVHQQVLCALAEVSVEDVLLPPEVLDMLGGAQSEENSLAQSSQDLRVDSGNVDETEVSLGILPEKAH